MKTIKGRTIRKWWGGLFNLYKYFFFNFLLVSIFLNIIQIFFQTFWVYMQIFFFLFPLHDVHFCFPPPPITLLMSAPKQLWHHRGLLGKFPPGPMQPLGNPEWCGGLRNVQNKYEDILFLNKYQGKQTNRLTNFHGEYKVMANFIWALCTA